VEEQDVLKIKITSIKKKFSRRESFLLSRKLSLCGVYSSDTVSTEYKLQKIIELKKKLIHELNHQHRLTGKQKWYVNTYDRPRHSSGG
jgi:hypothetical protein